MAIEQLSTGKSQGKNIDDLAVRAYTRTSRLATILSGASALLVLGGLLWSSIHLRSVYREYSAVEGKVQEKQRQAQQLQERVDHLKVQEQGYAAALNSVVIASPEASKVLTQSAAASPGIAQTVPRIFIHANGQGNMSLARAIAMDLRRQGYIVPAPDSLGNNRTPDRSLIVFFNDPNSGTTTSDIEKIQQAIKANSDHSVSFWVQLDEQHVHPARTYAIYLPTS